MLSYNSSSAACGQGRCNRNSECAASAGDVGGAALEVGFKAVLLRMNQRLGHVLSFGH